MSHEIGNPGNIAPDHSQASQAANFYPNRLRLMSFSQGCLMKGAMWTTVIGAALFGLSFFAEGGGAFLMVIFGILLGIFGVALFGLIFYIAGLMRENYRNGLLTAGIVTKLHPPTVIHIAALSKSARGEIVYGILRKHYDRFPRPWLKVGQRVPCASYFNDNVPHPSTWHSFIPTPIAFGTGDKKKVLRCLREVERGEDGDYFAILDRFLAQHPIPDDFAGIYVCDDTGNLIETRIENSAEEGEPDQ